jgi:hypothetical protein
MDGPTREPMAGEGTMVDQAIYNEAKRAASPSNPTKVPIVEQEKLTDELHMVIADLSNRLEAVLTPEAPTAETNGTLAEADEPKSQLTYRVEENNRKVRSAIRKIRYIIERIES